MEPISIKIDVTKLDKTAFYKGEKALGFLKGHGFEGAVERLLKAGLLPDDIRAEQLAENEDLRVSLHVDLGLSSELVASIHATLAKFDKVCHG